MTAYVNTLQLSGTSGCKIFTGKPGGYQYNKLLCIVGRQCVQQRRTRPGILAFWLLLANDVLLSGTSITISSGRVSSFGIPVHANVLHGIAYKQPRAILYGPERKAVW